MADPAKRRAKKDAREGKSASTQAGEFVREEIRHIREGEHGARSAKQAIAIGLSKARRAGVKLEPSENASKKVKARARREMRQAKDPDHTVSKARSRASKRRLEREGTAAGSKTALSRHAKASARKRTKKDRSASAKKAARTRKKTATKKKATKKAATKKRPAKKAAA